MTNPYLPPSDSTPADRPVPARPAPEQPPYTGYTPPNQPASSFQETPPYASQPASPGPAAPPYGYGGYGVYTGYPAYTPPPASNGLPKWAVGLISAGLAGVLGLMLGIGIGYSAGEDESYGVDDEWGTAADPYPFDNEPIQAANWSVTLNEAPREATEEITSAIPGHAAPADGKEFWIIPVKAEYIGGGTSTVTAGEQISMFFRDEDGRQYMDSCGAIPDDLAATGHPKDGESVAGNVCVQIPKDAKGVWGLFLEDGWGGYFSVDATGYSGSEV